jgi:hypothetical protein
VQTLTYPELEQASSKNQLDFVLTNPAHYILLTNDTRTVNMNHEFLINFPVNKIKSSLTKWSITHSAAIEHP